MSKAIPDGYHTVTASLTVKDGAEAIEFYQKAFGAVEKGRFEGPDGKLMHAEIQIGNAMVMLNDEVMGMHSPRSMQGSPVAFYLYFPDADAIFKQAIAAGAKQLMPMTEMFWGDRMGNLEDPFGYHWNVAIRVKEMTPDEIKKAGDQFMKQQMAGAK